MNQIFVRPSRPGALVRDPVTLEIIPSRGKLVERTPQWLRYVRCGDVIIEPYEHVLKKAALHIKKTDLKNEK